eukprot:5358945-Amphidinium_carterae.1
MQKFLNPKWRGNQKNHRHQVRARSQTGGRQTDPSILDADRQEHYGIPLLNMQSTREERNSAH